MYWLWKYEIWYVRNVKGRGARSRVSSNNVKKKKQHLCLWTKKRKTNPESESERGQNWRRTNPRACRKKEKKENARVKPRFNFTFSSRHASERKRGREIMTMVLLYLLTTWPQRRKIEDGKRQLEETPAQKQVTWNSSESGSSTKKG